MQTTLLKVLIVFIGLIMAFGIVKISQSEAPVVELPAPQPAPAPVAEKSIPELIAHWTSYYGSNYQELYDVTKCESGLQANPKGWNDGGKAYGPLQFHRPTFNDFARLLGEPLDYHSANDQIRLAAFVFTKGDKYKSHWTCWKTLYANKATR